MNIAIVLAGGIGARLGADIPKAFVPVQQKPLIIYCLEVLNNNSQIDKIQIVAAEDWMAQVEEWTKEYEVAKKVVGYSIPGTTRQLSIFNALTDLKDIESAEEISATIDDLISKVNTASLNMQRSVDSSSQQGELIVETGDKFKVILEKVSDLTRRASDISENVDSCVDANAKVMDAISNLSASSQEVAASAESSIHVSQDCETDMETTKNILHEILEISRSSENN